MAADVELAEEKKDTGKVSEDPVCVIGTRLVTVTPSTCAHTYQMATE